MRNWARIERAVEFSSGFAKTPQIFEISHRNFTFSLADGEFSLFWTEMEISKISRLPPKSKLKIPKISKKSSSGSTRQSGATEPRAQTHTSGFRKYDLSFSGKN